MSWNLVSVGDLVSLRQGFAINKNSKHYVSDVPTSAPILRIADMQSGEFNVFAKESIPDRFWASEEDIIYTRTGKVGLVFIGQRGIVHNNCFVVSPNDESILDRKYLFYALQAPSFHDKANSMAMGAAQPDLPHPKFKSIDIALPPLSSQRLIARVLNTYDSLIENNRRQIKLLEEAAQRLYKEWFIDLRFPGHKNTPIIDGLPEGWKRVSISDAYDVIKGCPYTSNTIDSFEGIPMITLASVKPFGGLKPYLERNYSGKYVDNQILCAGDVVMALTEQAIGLAGCTARIPKYADGYLPSMDLVVLRPKEGTREYLYGSCTYGPTSRKLSPLANGTKIKHLKPEVFGYMDIVVPLVELQRQYSDIVSRFYSQQDVLYEMTLWAVEARNRLLQKLMSGEIEV